MLPGMLGAITGAAAFDSFTVLLAHFDGADASASFIDSSAAPKTLTGAGNAQIDTAQSVYGGASLLLDGTGDSVSMGGSADFAFGSGDFTIDFRFRPSSVTGTRIFFDFRPTGTQGFYPTIYTDGTTLYFFTNSGNRITGASVLAVNTWYHVAVARSGTNTKMFLNGTQEGSTYVDSNTYLNGASRPIVGVSGTDGLTGWAGHVDEMRVSKGIARWTANFTPPTSPY